MVVLVFIFKEYIKLCIENNINNILGWKIIWEGKLYLVGKYKIYKK